MRIVVLLAFVVAVGCILVGERLSQDHFAPFKAVWPSRVGWALLAFVGAYVIWGA